MEASKITLAMKRNFVFQNGCFIKHNTVLVVVGVFQGYKNEYVNHSQNSTNGPGGYYFNITS